MDHSLATIAAAQKMLLEFIAAEQFSDGGFVSLSSSDTLFKECLEHTTNFAPALIGWCLAESVEAFDIYEKITAFLLRQRKENSSWNYWTEKSVSPCPDDLDDTFSVLLAILPNKFVDSKEIPRGALFADLVRTLTATETRPGGPYTTWLVDTSPSSDSAHWSDTDIAINATIAYFLGCHGISSPPLHAFLLEEIKNDHLHSSYYEHDIVVLYFLARAASVSPSSELKNICRSHLEIFSPNSPLQAAFIVLAWIFLEEPQRAEPAITYILEHNNDCTKPFPFWIDPAVNGITHYAGSSSVTAAHCFLALEKYRQHLAKGRSECTTISQAISDEVREKAFGWSSQWKSLTPSLERIFEKLMSAKPNAAVHLISWRLWLDMAPQHQNKISLRTLVELGFANACGWLAYSIFDDIVDEGTSIEILLPAVGADRVAYRTYNSLAPTSGWRSKVLAVFGTMERTVAREQNYYLTSVSILPASDPYKDSGNKSIGHALGPLLLSAMAGFSPISMVTSQIEVFFRHYLTARQLNDDAHDWPEDFARGILTPVVIMILQEIPERTGDETISQLREIFWNTTIIQVSQLIRRHTAAARQALGELQKAKFLIRDTECLNLILPLEKAAAQALRERDDTLAFMEKYSSTQ